MQKDLKRLVAYSSVAHLGFIVLGTLRAHHPGHRGRRAADGQPRRLDRRPVPPRRLDLRAPPHPRDLRAASGLQTVAPIFAGVFTVVMLSSIGVPGPQRLRRRVPHPASARSSPAAGGRWPPPSGVILAALYLLWAYQRVFHGEPDERERRRSPTSTPARGSCMAPLLGLIVFLGVYPEAGARPHRARRRPPRRARRGQPDFRQPVVATGAAGVRGGSDGRRRGRGGRRRRGEPATRRGPTTCDEASRRRIRAADGECRDRAANRAWSGGRWRMSAIRGGHVGTMPQPPSLEDAGRRHATAPKVDWVGLAPVLVLIGGALLLLIAVARCASGSAGRSRRGRPRPSPAARSFCHPAVDPRPRRRQGPFSTLAGRHRHRRLLGVLHHRDLRRP